MVRYSIGHLGIRPCSHQVVRYSIGHLGIRPCSHQVVRHHYTFCLFIYLFCLFILPSVETLADILIHSVSE